MNESRFKNCVMPLHKTLYAYALTILRNESDADDCIQEAFTRLWENRGRLSEIENVAGYATVTVKNIALSMVSRSRPAFDAIDGSIPDIADSAPTPSSLTEAKDDLEKLRNMLQSLPANQRRVLTLNGVGGLSSSEIHHATGLSEDNIRVLLSRGRKKLRELFSKI